MPYIITTQKPTHYGPIPTTDGGVKSRRAVATLDEARTSVAKWMHYDGPPIYDRDEWVRLDDAARSLPKAGGTIGPLPDGTVIEVREVQWRTLCDRTGLPYPGSDDDRARIIDAHNA